MTRAVTLADLMPSRAATTAKPAANDAAHDEDQSDCATCFAQVLEDAASADKKGESGRRPDQGDRDTARKADDAASTCTASGLAGSEAAGPSVRPRMGTEPPRNDAPLIDETPPRSAALSCEVPPAADHEHPSLGSEVAPRRDDPASRSGTQPPHGLSPHLAAAAPLAHDTGQSTHHVPLSSDMMPPIATSTSLPIHLPAPAAPLVTGPVSQAVSGLSTSAGARSVQPHALPLEIAISRQAPAEQTGATALSPAEGADAPTVPPALEATVPQTVDSPPPPSFAPPRAPEVPLNDAGGQARDLTQGTNGESLATPARLSPAGTPSSPSVVVEPITTPLVTTTSGEFTVHLGRAVSPDGAQQSQRSDFVASNAVLTATLSKPCSQADGTYSVTAMLNPPSLGHVQAVVRVDGTNISVAIVAHTPEGHHAIAGHLEELRTELEAHGGDVQLSLSDGGGNRRPRDQAEAAPATAPDIQDADNLVLTVTQAQGTKSLHVIL